MAYVKVYHNPHFLEYRGDHEEILVMPRPVASVSVSDEMTEDEMLAAAYGRTQHGAVYASWFQDPAVIPHLRSTSVGDLLLLPDGTTHVVENVGFRRFQPRVVRSSLRLWRAHRRLEAALDGQDPTALREAAQESLVAMEDALLIAGKPVQEAPTVWEKAAVGDVVGAPESGQYRVIARRLRPKHRAKRLLAHVPGSQLWLDGPRHWAVLAPVAESGAVS
jgi:hypothetical protein